MGVLLQGGIAKRAKSRRSFRANRSNDSETPPPIKMTCGSIVQAAAASPNASVSQKRSTARRAATSPASRALKTAAASASWAGVKCGGFAFLDHGADEAARRGVLLEASRRAARARASAPFDAKMADLARASVRSAEHPGAGDHPRADSRPQRHHEHACNACSRPSHCSPSAAAFASLSVAMREEGRRPRARAHKAVRVDARVGYQADSTLVVDGAGTAQPTASTSRALRRVAVSPRWRGRRLAGMRGR